MKKTAGIIAFLLTISLTCAPALALAAPQDAAGSVGNAGSVVTNNPQDAAGSVGNAGGTTSNNGFPNIDSVDKVLKVMDNLTNWMFTVFMILAVIFILLAAYKYLFSGGGEEVAKAHKMILYAAVAVAVAILARGVVHVVASLLTV